MVVRLVLALVGACGLSFSAQGEDIAASVPPTLALNPQPPPSIWSGLYVGSEVFVFSGKGLKGTVGGGVVAGYNHEFANNLVVGIDATTGFAPYLLPYGPFRGYDYATTNVKIGYDLGRLMPYVTTGVILAKPNTSSAAGYVSAIDSANNLVNSPSNLKAAATFGAGFDYAVSNNLRVGISVSAGTGRAIVAP